MNQHSPFYFVVDEGELKRYGPKPKTAIEAADQSIIKFLILKEKAELGIVINNGGAGTCGLCLFFRGNCKKCPIPYTLSPFDRDLDQHCGCTNTPFFDYTGAYEDDHADDAEIAAIAELRLLRRVRAKLVKEGNK